MLLLSLILLASHQNPSTELRVIRAEDEVAQLGARLSQKIILKSELSKHILGIRASQTDAETELAAVGVALRARITKDASKIVLSRESPDVQRDRAEWVKTRSLWIKESLSKANQVRKQYDANRDPTSALRVQMDEIQRVSQVRDIASDPELGRQLDLEPLSPGGNLVLKLFDRIGIDEIAKLPIGKALVFEDNPAPFSVSLPGCDDSKEAYRKELRALPDLNSMARPGTGTEIYNEKGIGTSPAEINLLRLTVAPQEETVNGRVEAFDKTGRMVGNGVLVLRAYAGPIGNDLLVEARNRPHSSSGFVELPGVLVDRIDLANRLSPILPDWMVAPTKWEPLSLGAGFAMQCLAGSDADRPLVVDLCDDLFRYAKTCIHGNQLNLVGFRAILDEWKPYEKVEGANYTVLRPINPDPELPIDRKLLQAFVTSVLSRQHEDTRLLAATLRQSNSRLLAEVRTAISSRPELSSIETQNPGGGVLRLIGAISDDGWASLNSGQVLTVEQLGIVGDIEQFLKDRGSPEGDSSLPELYRYPQELYRNAHLGETPIKIERRLEPAFRLRDLSNGSRTQWRELPQIGAHATVNAMVVDGKIAYSESRDDFEARLDRQFLFQTATRRLETLVIGMPRGRPLSYQLPQEIDDPSDEYHYLDLPQAFRNDVWRMVTEAAQNRLAHGARN